MSPRREDFLKAARKRKLTCLSQELQTRPKTKGNVPHETAVDSDTQTNEYEEIEVVESIQRANSYQTVYDSVEYYGADRELEDPSEQASSVTSAVSEPAPAERKRKFGTPSVGERRQLSALSTGKFYRLGQSPETVLDAIATCFDLTPDDWMVAWKLSQKGVPPIERARILGVRLQEDSYNDDK
ncbi:hypothetical protein AVEN_44944-1 [Araneus ventricosus]|uniref:Uncharacterized protein n=1 Tax=Araneus ventricosus TaxID=182803 RepID=A0A4Y2SCI7_ARAVE|nr:hypothetical protein AVEN_44944-1 [Araneus ventricosus]